MRLLLIPLAAGLQLLSIVCLGQSEHLNLTTIALVDNASVIQCWQLDQTINPVSFPVGNGIISSLGPLGDPVNATWESVPAGAAFPGQHPANAVE